MKKIFFIAGLLGLISGVEAASKKPTTNTQPPELIIEISQ